MVNPEIFRDLIAEVSAEVLMGGDVDPSIATMRAAGFSPVDCIKALIEITGCSLAEANRTIIFSTAWPEHTVGMTDRLRFEAAFDDFMAGCYPDRPRTGEFQDWGFCLFEFDSYIAGYATRVRGGHMRASVIPDLDSCVSGIGLLRASLEELEPSAEEDPGLIGEYRTRVAVVERMVVALRRLACSETE